MLLTIDIGNSLTKFGLFEGEFLRERFSISTVREAKPQHIADSVKLKRKFSAVIIASVAPELNQTYRGFFESFFNLKPIFVDNSFDFGLKIKYHPPENLGVDRIVDAFAAVEKYGKPCIVCDFGTATTIDAVNFKSEYLGGIIAPGMKTLAESLFLKTSKLPQVAIAKPEKVIGDSTTAAIQSGIFFGYLGLVENILQKMISELNDSPQIIATGGFANLLAENIPLIEIIDENLMLDGLRLTYEKAIKG